MIVRTWRGRVSKDRPDSYTRHFHDAVLPQLRIIDGFLGALLLRRETPDGLEFVVVTQWESLDAIKRIAGDNYEHAVIEPGDIAALESFDATVAHYDVISSVT